METRYIQRLTWTGGEYVTKYEVIIEQEENGEFTFKHSEFTADAFIEISFPPGNYRFRVIPYDFRDLPEAGTEWKTFAIIPAPALAKEPPPAEPAAEEPEFEEPPPKEDLPAEEIPAEESDKGKPIDFFISAFYMPVFPLYNELTETEPIIPGAAFRFGILFNRPAIFRPGIELAARWHTNTIDAEFNLLIQKTVFMLRLGAGLSAFSIPAPDTDAPPLTELFYANIDFSFLWQPLTHLYFEIGFAYSHHFTRPAVSGNFRPFIGIGTQL